MAALVETKLERAKNYQEQGNRYWSELTKGTRHTLNIPATENGLTLSCVCDYPSFSLMCWLSGGGVDLTQTITTHLMC